jgi:tetratricopeptide (TPR) repeat protein
MNMTPTGSASDDRQTIHFAVPGENGPMAEVAGQRGGPGSGAPASRLPGQVKTSVRVASQRAGGAPVKASAVPGEDVVALHVEGGPVLLLHPATARELLQGAGGKAQRGGSADDAIAVPLTLDWPAAEPADAAGAAGAGPDRGLLDVGKAVGKVVLTGFQVITGLAKDPSPDIVSSLVVRKADGQVEAGVYRLQPQALTPLKGQGARLAQVPASDQALLVLVHGTFVDTVSTFGKLWLHHSGRVQALFERYGPNVYALDHPTLGSSPVANARTLVDALPADARVHLVTHSRGGLVAEVLARLAGLDELKLGLDDSDARHFRDPAWAPMWAELQALFKQVQAKRIRVERLVRVACPARGTLLASGRLDAYLSVLRWGLEKTGVTLAAEVVDLLGEVARRRTDPAQIPGLAAMMPDTPLVNWLNAAPTAMPGDLRVVAGDLALGGLNPLNWLKSLLTDAYYQTAHDIVVNTNAMYGGAPRRGGATYLLDQGPDVTHFAYFFNDRTATAVTQALTSAQPPAGFLPIGPLSWGGKASDGQRGGGAEPATRGLFAQLPPAQADAAKPAVFVLPGILGSNLKHGPQGERIWLGLGLVCGFERLAYQPAEVDGVEPDGPIAAVYADLVKYLGQTHEVIPFGYDWRKPLELEAKRLAGEIDAALAARAASGQPVRILAHSMGGLLARTVQLEAPATWQRLMAHAEARFVMLGTPNAGSWAPMQVLSGDDTFGNALAAVGSPFGNTQARMLMAQMPGFLQLQAKLLDPQLGLDQNDTWKRLADNDLQFELQRNWWQRSAGEPTTNAYTWGVPPDAVLQQARALRLRLDAQVSAELPAWAAKTLLVVGKADKTPVGFEVGANGFEYLESGTGDGRVPLESALLPGVRTWTLDCDHGSLPSAERAFDAFADLLKLGATARLPQLSPEQITAARGMNQRGGGAGGGASTGPGNTGLLTRSRPARRGADATPGGTPEEIFASPKGRSTRRRGSAAAALPPLRVQVLNGSLAFVQQPLLLGHYRSLVLTGSEAVVDRHLGGAMNQALRAGLYPDLPGSHAAFVNTQADPNNPWQLPKPAAAVVVGLGAEGGLTPEQLQATVCQGVKAWAQRVHEGGKAGGGAVPEGIEIAATLIGSGGLGVTPGSAARAIAAGVAQANRRLAEIGWPLVSRLILVELFLDRAAEAWRGVRVLAQSDPRACALEPEIQSGTGPLRRQLDSSYRGANYDLISVSTAADNKVAFALDTRRARSEVRAAGQQPQLVNKLVERAATARTSDPMLGRTLFQLLVPLDLKPFLSGCDRAVLKLDDGTAPIPWELLDTDGGELPPGASQPLPWSIRTRLLRTLSTEVFRHDPHDASVEDAVLVVGEPAVPPGFPPLPGAKAEAQTVVQLLTGPRGLPASQVVALIDDDPFDVVIGQLLARPWRVIHVAGHGMPRTRDPQTQAITSEGGVVLSEGIFLGPEEIAKLPVVPELVFVNCCHLGEHENQDILKLQQPNAFAATVADALIRIGVRCVVAAGWAVDDEPALIFASTFYDALLAGNPFIEAVGRARRATWETAPQSKTWAAYQCYGDPDWTLRNAVADAQGGSAPHELDAIEDVASAPGLALVLEDLAIRSEYATGTDAEVKAQRQKARAHLDALEHRHADTWGSVGAVAEAYAVAWKAVGDSDAAIRWFERAVQANDASASLKAQEQLGNLRARRAWDQARAAQASDDDREAARVELTAALAGLQTLAALQGTAERWSLVGSALKRLGQLQRLLKNADAAQVCWQRAEEAYGKAQQLAADANDPQLFYPGLNRMAMQRVLHRPADPAADAPVRASLRAEHARKPDFWKVADTITLQLMDALGAQDGSLAAQQPALATAYAELHGRVAAPWLWRSVEDQLVFLLDDGGLLGQAQTPDGQAAQALLDLLKGYRAS